MSALASAAAARATATAARICLSSGVHAVVASAASAETWARAHALLRAEPLSPASPPLSPRCLLLCAEADFKYFGGPVAAALRRAGLQPYAHALRGAACAPERDAVADAAALARRTGAGWLVAAGGAELLGFAKAVAAAAGDGAAAGAGAGAGAWAAGALPAPSLPLVCVPSAWAPDAASRAHARWLGPGNAGAAVAHAASRQAAVWDGVLAGRLGAGPEPLRDALALLALCAEAALPRDASAGAGDAAAAAAAAGMQHAVLLARRLLLRGSRPPTDDDLAADGAHGAAAAAAAGALHAAGLLGVCHALPQALLQLHRVPSAPAAGALAPHALDWLWRAAQADLDRAAGHTDGWGAPLLPAEAGGAADAQAAGGDDGGEDTSDDAATELPRSRLRHLDLVARLLRATLRDCRGAGAEAADEPGPAAPPAAAGSAAPAAPPAPFAGLWRAIFDGGLAPGTAEERAAVLAPPLTLSRAERELLAATAELHDSALSAPTVPSKADLDALLAAMLPPAVG
jgi:hypothetical protein